VNLTVTIRLQSRPSDVAAKPSPLVLNIGSHCALHRLRPTHGEVPAYNIAEVPWSKAECPTEGSGHAALGNGHVSATPSPSGHLGGGLL